MNYWYFSIIILCCLSAGLTIYRYLRFSITTLQKIFLISLRILLIFLIFIAFIEPVFKFERLVSPDSTISVLLDASQSMQLFSPESTIVPLLKKLKSSNQTNQHQKNSFKFYLFGDSLREIQKLSDITFQDTKSTFPFSLNNPDLKSSAEILIISDGNWSNNTIPYDALSDKNVYYHNLSTFNPHPYLKISFKKEFNSVTADSDFKIESNLEIRTRQKSQCIINLYNGNTLIGTTSTEVDSGTFSSFVSIPSSGLKPGKHILRIEALLHEDTLHSVDYAMYTSISDSFKYSFASLKPSLNQRFLKLALSRKNDFKETSLNNKPDAIFFLSWNSRVKNHIKKLNKHAIAVFASVLPDGSSFKPAPKLSYMKNITETGVFFNLNTEILPPPSRIFNSKSIKNISPLLSAIHNSDTSHIVFAGNYSGYPVLALAISDFWKWDFWPVSHENTGEESTQFSDFFVSVLKDLLIDRSFSDQYTAFAVSPVIENDSLQFSLSFPSDINASVSDSVNILFSIFNENSQAVIDTSFMKKVSGLPDQTIKIAGLSNGKYSYKTVLSSKNNKFEYTDSLFVKPDNSELIINGQNNLLLKEIGYPVLISDTLFNNKKTHVNETTVTDYFSITKSWYLLSVILLLFLCELVLRRRFRLD